MAFIACWSRNAKIYWSCMLPPLPCASLPSLLFKIFVGAGGMTALPTKVPCPQGSLGGTLFPHTWPFPAGHWWRENGVHVHTFFGPESSWEYFWLILLLTAEHDVTEKCNSLALCLIKVAVVVVAATARSLPPRLPFCVQLTWWLW